MTQISDIRAYAPRACEQRAGFAATHIGAHWGRFGNAVSAGRIGSVAGAFAFFRSGRPELPGGY